MNIMMIAIPAIVLLSAGAIAGAFISAKKRREALMAAAAALNLTYTPKGSKEMVNRFGHFKLFQQGYSKQIANLMSGTANDIDMDVFDYQYTTGSGKSSSTFIQSVISFRTDKLDLPDFTLTPENVFHRIGAAMGMQDIDFESYPLFSKQVLLKGPDEEAVRTLFHRDAILYFEQNPKLCVDGSKQSLIIYRTSKRIKPEELQSFMKQGFEIFSLFKTE